ncbi:glycosyltransferase family 87 protein [Variovorax sp. KK3]|uniref:glycosyltransferase family 87 protein n=1 Tax=Variovorax sp. KK3 TaxID=1855728 RepID=UPI00097C71AC|nr:glycosyltransferase family 87 protein [Variovorax sp. KK3]
MKILIASVALTLLCAGLLFVLWRHRPGIPGLVSSRETQRLESTWRLWLICLVGGVALSALLALAVGAQRETSLGYLRIVLSSHAGEDSWMPMLRASAFLQAHPDTLLYQGVFFGQHVKFQYPLTALLPLDLPQWLFGLSGESVVTIFQIVSRLSLVAIALVFFKLFMGAMQASSGGRELKLPKMSKGALIAMSLASTLLFYPLLRSEYHGQIQTLMTLAAGLALLAWQRDQPRLAGVLMALCCIIKPQWGVVVLWALLRRQWQFALFATVATGVAGLLALAVYGWNNVFDYVSVVSFLGRHGESYFINQSVNGLMHRFYFNGVNLQGAGQLWSGTDFPPYHQVVHLATVVTSALLLVLALVWRIGKRPSTTDLGLVMLTLTMASPIAWDHHYALLLPVFAVVFPAAVKRQPFGAWTMPVLFVTLTLSCQSFVGPTNLAAGSVWNVLQSYQFAGAVMALVLLYRLSWLEQPLPSAARRDGPELAPATVY